MIEDILLQFHLAAIGERLHARSCGASPITYSFFNASQDLSAAIVERLTRRGFLVVREGPSDVVDNLIAVHIM